MTTMDEKYGDGTNCIVCDGCGLCITHGDCKADGCGKEVGKQKIAPMGTNRVERGVRWISTDKSVPKAGLEVLAISRLGKNKRIQLIKWATGDEEDFSHFMLIPEKPKSI